MAKMPIVPPGGFAGFSQQTPAVQALLRKKRSTRKKRKKTTRKKSRATARSRTRARSRSTARTRRKTGRLKKGSAAAKRRMAELRAMRGRTRRR